MPATSLLHGSKGDERDARLGSTLDPTTTSFMPIRMLRLVPAVIATLLGAATSPGAQGLPSAEPGVGPAAPKSCTSTVAGREGGRCASARQPAQRWAGADAGGVPTEEALRRQAAHQVEQGESRAYLQTLEELLRYHPSAAYWRERIQRLQRESGFDPLLLVDSYRLLFAVGAMQDAPEYTSLAELALQANLPAEARAVLDTGFAAGVLGAGPDAATHLALRQRVDKLAADDAKQLARAPDPGPDASADLRVATGLALATEGHTERGIALVEQGLAQGHLTQPAKVRLRLAWISAQAGRTDAARAVLQSLQGRDDSVGEIARLWLIHLDGPADAAAPAASVASH